MALRGLVVGLFTLLANGRAVSDPFSGIAPLPPLTGHSGKMSPDAKCGIYATDAALEIPDMLVYTMVTASRCAQTIGKETDGVCAIDASATIESAAKIVNSIMKAVQHCSHGKQLNSGSAKCGMDSNKLVESAAGLSEAAAGIGTYCGAEKDPRDSSGPHGKDPWGIHGFSHCMLGGTNSAKSFLMLGMRAKQTAEACGEEAISSEHCTQHALQLAGTLADGAAEMLKISGQCQQNTKISNICASHTVSLLKSMTEIGAVAKHMEKTCGVDEAVRLYDERARAPPKSSASFLNLGLAAFLPAVAVISFVAGRRMSKAAAPGVRDVHDSKEAGIAMLE